MPGAGALGAAATTALVAVRRDQGVGTIFLSAASDDAAKVYRALGFVREGRAHPRRRRMSRQARLTAEITALSEAVTMFASSPTPHRIRSPTAH